MTVVRRGYESKQNSRLQAEEDERDDRSSSRRGEYMEVGGYRGYSFDPNFRGRGRGRGRSRAERHYKEASYSPGPSQKEEPKHSYGQMSSGRKPWKDSKGFNRGGRGDTRYFLIKSFNEENVLRCIEDSTWTTQVHVGETLEEAFRTSKNVILVFSINKSKAFQGYARMESLPGSAVVPSWQKAINWESAGAFKVRWLVISTTQFYLVSHLKNSYNENQLVLIGKDGQEIEEGCGSALLDCIDAGADEALESGHWHTDRFVYDDGLDE